MLSMKKKIITIAGKPGSGKSSTARGVARKLRYNHFSSGDLFRQIAKEYGISVEELNKKAETQPEIDHQVDEKLRQLGNDNELVIDSRTAFHWIPDSYKIYLDLDPSIAAKRVYNQIKNKGRASQQADSIDDLYTQTLERYESENKRYNTLYNLNPGDLDRYNLVIDTSKHNLNEVISMITSSYSEWLKEEN